MTSAQTGQRKVSIVSALEWTAWSSGVLLVLLYGVARGWSEYARVEAIEVFRHQNPPVNSGASPASLQPRGNTGLPDRSLWSRQRVSAFAKSVAAPGAPEGVLRIPSVQLEVPVYADANEINLNRGAAHIQGTAALSESGNVGIAAHRDGFFRKLKDLELGREVFLEVGGRTLRYEVVDLSIATPSDVQMLVPTPIRSLTLVTCFPFYFAGPAPQRYIVRAQLADVQTIHRSSANQEE